MLLATIDRTSFEDQEASDQFDGVFRNIGSQYDSIYLIDLDDRYQYQSYPLISLTKTWATG